MIKLIKSAKIMARHIELQRAKARSIGLVPTMGYLHEGHLSLIRAAVPENDLVIVSIFVNPTQFGPNEDYRRYPRDLKRDMKLAAEAGASLVFCPSAKNMYPKGYRTYVNVTGITEALCGRMRLGHFKGVTTVVNKLFNIICPDRAYFFQKYAQKAVVIKRMVNDLNMPVKIKTIPIVRERDGLAMSSRNVYLSKTERRDALCLYESLKLAKRMIRDGVSDADRIKSAVRRSINSKKSARIDYISIIDINDLKKLKRIKNATLIAIAVRIGRTRLIDNIIIRGRI